MKRGLLALLVVAAAGAYAVDGLRELLGALHPVPWEAGRVASRRLDETTRARLAALDGEVLVTYFVSPRAAMPSEMRRLEREVSGLLEQMRAASDGRLDWAVVHPEERPDLATWLSQQGVAPFRARSVRHDAWSEREVFSTLRLSYAGRGVSRLDRLGPEHLPVLQELVRAHLDELEDPSAPRIAVAGPHTARLAALCGRSAEVVAVDFDATAELPDADLLFWVAPAGAEPRHRRALERFVEAGGSAVVAGTGVRLELDRAPDEPVAVRRREPGPEDDAAALALAAFGLAATPGVLMDTSSEEIVLDGLRYPAPWRVRCIAPSQDFRGLAGQPNGNLLFDAPTAWRWDPEELDARALDVRPLATTSAEAWVADLAAPARLSDLAPRDATAVARQTLAVLVEPRDPWRGRVAAFGSASVFQDEEMGRSQNAHSALVRVLVDTFTSRERRVLRRAGVRAAEPLPPLGSGARIGWRAAASLGLPAALGLVMLLRRRRGPRGAGRARRGANGVGVAAAALALAAAAGALWRALPLDALRLDATRAGVHALDPATRALCASAPGPRTAELCFSDRLPPGLAAGRAALRGKLADLRRAGLDLDVRVVAPDDLDPDGQRALEERGVVAKPFAVRSGDEESVRRLWSSLVLSDGAREVVLDFPAPIAFENLEFRLAAALWNLENGRAPRALVAAETPRLSPAEEHVQYRSRGLFAPGGTDVFRLARELLALNGFEVATTDPRAPAALDPDAPPDLLVWLQPRRDVTPMARLLAEHLRAGGSAIVGAQHFEMQSRQPRREGLAVVHWPQPWFCDLETGWLADAGVALVRDCLFDRVSGRRAVRSKVELEAGTERLEGAESTQPFLVRAVAAGFADDPLVERLGDLLFASGSRIALDEARLAARGLEARVLVRASADAWTYAWQGGDLPAAVLAGEGPVERVPGAPLAVLVEGRFPPFEADVFGPDAARPGRLLLVGSSTMFTSDEILAPDYDHAGLFLNAAADLALGPELGALMARRVVPQGFAPPDEERRLLLRAGVVGLVPLALLAAGLARLALVRRRRGGAS